VLTPPQTLELNKEVLFFLAATPAKLLTRIIPTKSIATGSHSPFRRGAARFSTSALLYAVPPPGEPLNSALHDCPPRHDPQGIDAEFGAQIVARPIATWDCQNLL